ncbi:MAG: cation diffusion facilitator family transporter [Dehalococcoidales bacterium]|jgi:cation diffusion facilitator family transporter|nr:cation diffusion facilitator family transporter [Dehalococcoidales bacterium]
MLAGNRTARIASFAVAGLVLVKIIAGILTGSLSIFAQTADSAVDLFAVIVSFITLRVATKPADREHPFGHGKMETVAVVTQGLLIFLIGVVIAYFAVQRILKPSAISYPEIGMVVMAFSILVSFILSRYILGRREALKSSFLMGTAQNIAADIYSALAVLAGMVVIRFTRWYIIDPVIALLIVIWLFKIAVGIIRRSSHGLIDEKLPPAEEEIINATIMEHCSQLLGYHRLRTRKSGYQRYIDLHLVVPRDTSVADAHRITEHLEQDIRRKLPHTSMIIHIEPCDNNCAECTFPCKQKQNLIKPDHGF